MWNAPWQSNRLSGVTDTAAFKRWFGNSVVRNPDGSPRVVYHGTTVEDRFTKFRPGPDDIGIHFGTYEQAEIMATQKEGGHIYPVYLRLENPIRLQDEGGWDVRDVIHRLNQKRILSKDELLSVWNVHYASPFDQTPTREVLVKILLAHGYDGIVYQNTYEVGFNEGIQDSFLVFDPRQVKSATGNSGSFDPDDPDILHGWW